MANFGRVVEVMVNNMSFSMDHYAIEGTIPFDNDLLPNESEVKLWNLSKDTLNRIKRNDVLMINAGYRGDVGVILHGFISRVITQRDGVDKITTINVLDSQDLSRRKVEDVAYASGTLGSYILKEMAKQLGLPIAQFQLNQDYRYDEGYTASGEVTEIISKVAADCGTSAFINKGKLYVRNLRKGADDVFSLSVDTGLIGTPEPFEDDKFKGYMVKSQLQYRITTASVIDLQSKDFTGRMHVRSGSHQFSRTGDFITEAEAILP
ncbi:phage protein [Brevibacillus sp. NPDC003359]|uniref:phage protein n=1 Tax=unclassified Brevibacillus TaxID=2684853 RepID=UPI0036D06262